MENPKLYKNYDKKITNKLESKLSELAFEHGFTPNAISILNKRYFKKDEKGVAQEDVYGLFRRVAANIAYPDFHYTKMKKKQMKLQKNFMK